MQDPNRIKENKSKSYKKRIAGPKEIKVIAGKRIKAKVAGPKGPKGNKRKFAKKKIKVAGPKENKSRCCKSCRTQRE